MLRSMFYYGSIISSRYLTDIASFVVTRLGGYYMVWSCDELTFAYAEYGLGGVPESLYPQCFAPNATGETMVPVMGVRDGDSNVNTPAAFGSAYNAPFGSMVGREDSFAGRLERADVCAAVDCYRDACYWR